MLTKGGRTDVSMEFRAASTSFDRVLFIFSESIIMQVDKMRGQYHFLSKTRWLDATLMSIRCSTLKHRQSLMNYLLSLDMMPFWVLGKFTTLALSIMPSFKIRIWLIWLPKGFSPKSIS